LKVSRIRVFAEGGCTITVSRRNGWTEAGDDYGIEGGKDYVKENGCYHIILNTVNRLHELWEVPARGLSVEQLEHKLQGPLEVDNIGPFGREFLKANGKLIFQSRLPPK
jgi:hypothetical protein